MTRPPRPYGFVERDLVHLVGKRVNAAIMSVLQLAEDETQGFMIATAAEAEAAAVLAGVYCAKEGVPVETVKPVEIAIAVLQAVRDASSDEVAE